MKYVYILKHNTTETKIINGEPGSINNSEIVAVCGSFEKGLKASEIYMNSLEKQFRGENVSDKQNTFNRFWDVSSDNNKFHVGFLENDSTEYKIILEKHMLE